MSYTGRISIALCFIVLFVTVSNLFAVTSVYVITDTSNSKMNIYNTYDDVLDDLVPQITNFSMQTGGAVGVAIDSVNEFLFITFEGQGYIEIINAKTMEYVTTINAPNASNLAGIQFDSEKSKVYAVQRASNHLYSYTWNPETLELTLDYYPYYTLSNVTEAYGIAVDAVNERLYVGDARTTDVRYFNTDDWTSGGSIDLSYPAIGVAIDTANNYLYAGSAQIQQEVYLMQYDLSVSDPNYAEVLTNVGSFVLGIATDDDGLVYITTYGVGTHPDRIMVFDPTDMSILWESGDVGNPAGIAIASGVGYKPPSDSLTFYKTADFENVQATCANPSDPNSNEITYEIFYGNPITDSNDPNYLGDVVVETIIDYLPEEIDIMNVVVTGGGVHNFLTNTVTWSNIGTLEPGDSGSVTVTVTVIENAEPSSVMTNLVELETEKYYIEYELDTDVCCWGGDIIYVSADAKGFSTGTSWCDAYTNLQHALSRARKDCGSEIWIAKGTYKPTSDVSKANAIFSLEDYVDVYGGFEGNESSAFDLDDRNLLRNKTYLSGYLDETHLCNYVIGDANDVTLDGVIITDAGQAGVLCNDTATVIQNCLITDNSGSGIKIMNGAYPTISRCIIRENSVGIDDINGSSEITNSWIHHNVDEGLLVSSSGFELRNCTVVYNGSYGVWSDASPTITNSIFWGNNSDGKQLEECSATYSCVYDPNVAPFTTPDSVTHNINSDPLFAYSNPELYDFHLSTNSPCIEWGNTDIVGTGEIDIDGNDRVEGDDVDMGADEYSCSDITNDIDFNTDAIVDFYEYSLLANAWLSHDPNDPNFDEEIHDATNWDERFDFDSDYDVDIDDLTYFATEWLWQPCYVSPETPVALPMGAESMTLSPQTQSLSIEPVTEVTVEEKIANAEEILDWLDEMWLDADIQETISEEQWTDFRESIEQWIDINSVKVKKKK